MGRNPTSGAQRTALRLLLGREVPAQRGVGCRFRARTSSAKEATAVNREPDARLAICTGPCRILHDGPCTTPADENITSYATTTYRSGAQWPARCLSVRQPQPRRLTSRPTAR